MDCPCSGDPTDANAAMIHYDVHQSGSPVPLYSVLPPQDLPMLPSLGSNTSPCLVSNTSNLPLSPVTITPTSHPSLSETCDPPSTNSQPINLVVDLSAYARDSIPSEGSLLTQGESPSHSL